MRTILIVDDDQKTRALLKAYLEKNKYEVIAAHDGESFLVQFRTHADKISLMILDLVLPDTDGFSLCQTVRQCSEVPIIMLTASSDETDRIIGLEMGADDYLAKPYSPRELLARIKAILRRTENDLTPGTRYYRFVGYTLDALERTVIDNNGAMVALTGLDFQLLKYFLDHPGVVLDHRMLCEAVRGRYVDFQNRSLVGQISRLRLHLNNDRKHPRLIRAVRGFGYVFSANVSTSRVEST